MNELTLSPNVYKYNVDMLYNFIDTIYKIKSIFFLPDEAAQNNRHNHYIVYVYMYMYLIYISKRKKKKMVFYIENLTICFLISFLYLYLYNPSPKCIVDKQNKHIYLGINEKSTFKQYHCTLVGM